MFQYGKKEYSDHRILLFYLKLSKNHSIINLYV